MRSIAPMESIKGPYKTEVIPHQSPLASAVAMEIAALESLHWHNHIRLHQTMGYD